MIHGSLGLIPSRKKVNTLTFVDIVGSTVLIAAHCESEASPPALAQPTPIAAVTPTAIDAVFGEALLAQTVVAAVRALLHLRQRSFVKLLRKVLVLIHIEVRECGALIEVQLSAAARAFDLVLIAVRAQHRCYSEHVLCADSDRLLAYPSWCQTWIEQ